MQSSRKGSKAEHSQQLHCSLPVRVFQLISLAPFVLLFLIFLCRRHASVPHWLLCK
jgi:hypothetical protein